jgi:type I restriction enzyme, S subunit
MSSKVWKTYRLSEFAEVQNGYAFKSDEFVKKGIPVIKIKNLVSPKVSFEDVQYFNGKTNDKLTPFVINKNDILISMTGSHINQLASAVGKIARYQFDYPALLNQRVGKIYVKDRSVCDEGYLFYFLNRIETQIELASSAGGSANQANISSSQIKMLSLLLPPLPTQCCIVDVLSALDEKIELNRQTNATLEAIAQAIFKEWFVDFNFPGATGDMVEAVAVGAGSVGAGSEPAPTGMIPRGWRVGKLGDVCKNVRRTVHPREIAPETAYVGLEHIPRKSLGLLSWGVSEEVDSQKSYFKKHNILFGKLRPYFHKVCIAPLDGICSTDILVIEPSKNNFFSFCLNHLFSDEMITYVSAVADGTRMPRVDWKSISNYEIFLPSDTLISQFNEVTFPFYEEIIENNQQSKTLAVIRDTLLPKLMSGEIEV